MKRTKNLNLLIFTICIALFTHALVLYKLHDFPFQSRINGHQYKKLQLSKSYDSNQQKIAHELFQKITVPEHLTAHEASIDHDSLIPTQVTLNPIPIPEQVTNWSDPNFELSIKTHNTAHSSNLLANENISYFPSLKTTAITSKENKELCSHLTENSLVLPNDLDIDIPELYADSATYSNSKQSQILIGLQGHEQISHLAGMNKQQTFKYLNSDLESLLIEDYDSKRQLQAENVASLNSSIISGGNDFDVMMEYLSQSDASEYLFRIKLFPKKGVSFHRIKQNYFFLVDRSNSIDRERYQYTKQAVLSCIQTLRESDFFNIFLFDSKIQKFTSTSVAATNENIQKALHFLDSQKHGGLFASTDLYKSLDTLLPNNLNANEVNTAILLSDGDTYLSQDQQRKTIAKWTQKNHGKVALFSVATGKKNNLALMELLSAFNKGTLAYAPKPDQLQEKLKRLMLAIRNPIAKDITVTLISKDPSVEVTLYPSNERVPNLYSNIPFVLIGKTNKLSDLHLFIQGKYYNRWLEIKKTLAFEDARQAHQSLGHYYTVQRAYDHYKHYLNEGKRSHLAISQKLLRPLRIPVAFQ